MAEHSESRPHITLRPFTDADRFMLSRWLGSNATTRRLGSRSAGEAVVAMAAADSTAIRSIISVDGKAVAYVQAVEEGSEGLRVRLQRSQSGRAEAGYGHDLVTIEVFFGDDEQADVAIIADAAARLAGDVFQTSLALHAAMRVNSRDEAMTRALERRGFCWTAIVEDLPQGPAWLLVKGRST